MKKQPIVEFKPMFVDPVASREEYCLCASCENFDFCKYRGEFIEYQQSKFPAKIDCYLYREKEVATNE